MITLTAGRSLRRQAKALMLTIIGLSAAPLHAEDPPPPRPGSELAQLEPEKPPKEPDERPELLAPILKATNPARLQRFFDLHVGPDSEDHPRRPEAPEIGEPVFFDLTRPLGDRKYANEGNYLLNSSTRNAATLQVIEYEYTFADWRSVELDLSYFNENLEILSPFYQRTLGVGRRRNWVHGYQVSPDLYLRSGFVGGSALYAFAWKPEVESPFSTLIFFGANRALIGGFHPSTTAFSSSLSSSSSRFPTISGGDPSDKVYGAWRPTLNVNLFAKISEKFTLGIENDLFFQSGRASEYLSFPFLSYKPSEHAFFQVGGGYYHFESRDQFTFMLHLNFVNVPLRKPREEEDNQGLREESQPEKATTPDSSHGRGRLRRCLDRWLAW